MLHMLVLCWVLSLSKSESAGRLDVLTDSLLHEFVSRLGGNQNIDEINEYTDETQVCFKIIITNFNIRIF